MAQETEETTAFPEAENAIIQDIEEEQAVSPQDLDTQKPKLLPDSRFYFLKDWWRDTKLFFTFNPVKKAELRQRIASEKLLEWKKLIEQGKNPAVIERAQKGYEIQQEKLGKAIEKIKENNTERAEKFKEKFVQHQALHNRIMEKLENQIQNEEALKKIQQARERHLERFGEVMFKLGDEDKIPQRLENALENIKGSELKGFKNLELLKEVKERVQNEEKKEVLQQAEERITERFKEKIEQLAPEKQEEIKTYIKNLPGDKIKQLQILEEIKERVRNREELRQKLEEGKENLLEQISFIEVPSGTQECPVWSAPASGFCQEGRVIIEESVSGCPLPPKCITPGEIVCEVFITCEEGHIPFDTGQRDSGGCPIKKCIKGEPIEEPVGTCISLWDPVCGKNGKTYSNACLANLAGAEIDYKGVCQEAGKPCAKESERVNRNPLLGSTDKVCCAGLYENRVSKSYSVCAASPEAPSITPIPAVPLTPTLAPTP